MLESFPYLVSPIFSFIKTEHYEVVLKAGDMERVMPECSAHLARIQSGSESMMAMEAV